MYICTSERKRGAAVESGSMQSGAAADSEADAIGEQQLELSSAGLLTYANEGEVAEHVLQVGVAYVTSH